MRGSAVRRKSVPLSRAKLTRLRTILGAKTDAEAVDRALNIAITDAAIDPALRRTGGKAALRRVFRSCVT